MMSKFSSVILGIIAAVIMAPATALELGSSSELHGFVSQAYLYSPDNPYAGTDSLDGSFKFREIGITGFTEVSPEFRLAGQVISRQRDESDDGDLRIDFLLADYLFYSDMGTTAGVRLGRVKNNVGFYNATRDIPSARPGFNVPDSIYFDSLRDSILSTDGINLYGSRLFQGNQLNWEVFAGRKSVESERLEYYIFGRPVSEGEFNDMSLYGLNLNFVPAAQRSLKLGFSLLDSGVDLDNPQSVSNAQMALFAAGPADIAMNAQNYVTGTRVDVLFAILSAQYSYRDWVITAEYMNLFSDLELQIAGVESDRSNTTEAYYLQVEWLPTLATSWFVRYEELYLNKDDRSGGNLLSPNDPYRGFGKGWSLGGKWMFYPRWTVTGQASFNEGTAWLPSYSGIEDYNVSKYWNYYVISLTFQF
ncbi:hypothetical protein [Marinobacter sp. 1_MG-2023]|uniref:hypothetical protein n=1 Tax=Marinobacter sp. 1_MG-2023 TaxID=3062627 RepID=UPI0026E28645|nr:hypothetical protein [Marinobacter sp. 1_MG-2023]MDO6822952.1 hypothetical protein [Marinobacter sp. 1_MG-2023]